MTTLKKLSVACLLILFTATISAQTGVITGTVKSADIEEPLPFVNVVVAGTTIGVATDLDGKFYLAGVPEGTQTIVFSYMGYDNKEEAIEIKAAETITLNALLQPSSIVGEEVIIRGQLLGQKKAINQQVNSDAIVNVVSEDKIKELPDVNAAEAIARIPGIGIQRSGGEGQKIMVRGLDPKYTNITVNGVKLPSNDPTNKSVDISMISSELLSGIEVYKSPTPDMDADAVGGTVNLGLQKASTRNGLMQLKLTNGYNHMHNDFNNYNGSLRLNKRFLEDKVGVLVQGNYEKINRGTDILGGSRNTGVVENGVPVPEWSRVELLDREEIRHRYGANLTLDYSLKNHSIVFNTWFSQSNQDFTERGAHFTPGHKDHNFWAVIDDNQVNLSVFSNTLSGEHKFAKLKIDWNVNGASTSKIKPYSLYMRFPDDDAYPNTSLVDGRSDYRDIINDAGFYPNSAFLRDLYFEPDSVFETVYSANINTSYDIITNDNIKITLKAGGKLSSSKRRRDISGKFEKFYYNDNDVRQTSLTAYGEPMTRDDDGRILLSNFIDPDFDAGEFLSGTQEFQYPLSAEIAKNWYQATENLLYDNRKLIEDRYEYNENITAGYFMANIKAFNKLTLITGLRYEHTQNELFGYYSTINGRSFEKGVVRDTSATKSYGELFPHVHAKFQATDWMDIRFSYSQTLARPDFYYLIPTTLVNLQDREIDMGNPDVEHMVSENYDLTLSFYKGKYGLFTISGFYKDINNVFFERPNLFLETDSMAAAMGFPGKKDYRLSTYGNTDNAKAYGFEIDLQTNLSFLPAPLNGIVFTANYTRLFSETSVYYSKLDTTILTFDNIGNLVTINQYSYPSRKISIPGQVPHKINVSLGYDYKGFSGRISAIYQGHFLQNPGTQVQYDDYSYQFWRFDASLKQTITENIDLFMNIVNFDFKLNEHDEIRVYNNSLNTPKAFKDYGVIINTGIKINI